MINIVLGCYEHTQCSCPNSKAKGLLKSFNVLVVIVVFVVMNLSSSNRASLYRLWKKMVIENSFRVVVR